MLDRLRERYHYGRYRRVKELIGDNRGDLLDIGCGKPCDSMEDGSFIKYLGYGTGMDIKECAPGFDFKQGDIYDIPFAEKSFDIIVAMEVLEHITDLDLALRDIRRVLRDDGIFIISTPDNSLLWRIIWFFWERTVGGMWKETHETNLRQDEWINTLSRYFKIVDIQTYWEVGLIVKMRGKKEGYQNE